MIDDFEPIERSNKHARKALSSMNEQDIAPSPLNYAVWYAHCSGQHPSLSRALESKLNSERGLSRAASQELFERFLGTELESSGIRETGDQLHGSLEAVLKLVVEAGQETGSYGDKLAGVQDNLAERPEAADVGHLVQVLLAETEKMVEKSRDLESGLKDSAKEIQELRDHLEQVREEAMTDALTGVANRKCFDLKLAEAIEQAEQEGESFCLLLSDIDHFKAFNDSYGHKVGDEVLKVVGRHLREGVKGRDTAARYGGEEFALILPQTQLDGATSLAEALRLGLAKKELKNRKTGESFGQVTLSIGAAAFRPDDTADSMIERADAALYLAKRNGRNRVENEAGLVSPPQGPSSEDLPARKAG